MKKVSFQEVKWVMPNLRDSKGWSQNFQTQVSCSSILYFFKCSVLHLSCKNLVLKMWAINLQEHMLKLNMRDNISGVSEIGNSWSNPCSWLLVITT